MKLQVVKMHNGYSVRINNLLRDYYYVDVKDWAVTWGKMYAYKYSIFPTLEEAVACYDALSSPGVVVEESLITKARNGRK